MNTVLSRYSLICLLLLCSGRAAADEIPEFNIVIKNHAFQPAELIIPAGVKVRLVVDNQDATPEEFESHELNREKVIPANSKVKIYVGPLEAGVYPYFGDFNPKSATGKILVR
ncbi:MAG TPA: cupredoxin domain-containing protein [Pseudomonadales bacterium]|nr:cupredoxin domain-containing protein [Pseudomonadales bacterium]